MRVSGRADGGAQSQRQPGDRSVPPKVREVIAELERAGFVNRGGKGGHRNFVHPRVVKPVTISGNAGDDAKHYQVRAVRLAIEESRE
jgi:predicted RNA binding protein YcfA (HicA-like mRNA interferase family)